MIDLYRTLNMKRRLRMRHPWKEYYQLVEHSTVPSLKHPGNELLYENKGKALRGYSFGVDVLEINTSDNASHDNP